MKITTHTISVLLATILVMGCGTGAPPAGGPPSSPMSLPPLEWPPWAVQQVPAPKTPPTQGIGGVLRPSVDLNEFDAVADLIRHGHSTEAIQALERHPELIHYAHPQLGSLILRATGDARLDVVKYLLDQGVDPNVSTAFGWTPLSGCVYLPGGWELKEDGRGPKDHLPVFDLLLLGGADPEKSTFYRLDQIVNNPYVPAITSLLEGGEWLQRSRRHQTIARSAILARLREHLNLPVDALLPMNADSLYLGLPQLEE